ncbi:Flp pilus assembly complex ATPase component TadA [Candidatus Saccharibacteria bacterium]|nr:MAG: Flp pilus assembly complex ATPase component TadA [Candidatus Saccharibacteria bacterium]
MSMISAEIQKRVEESLVEGGEVTAEKLQSLHALAEDRKMPFFGLLIAEKIITNEHLTKLIARASNTPYVDLSNAKVDPDILQLVPQDLAQRYMAVPLGESGNRIIIGMLDPDNVQATDFLSNKIGRPLKVYAASEEGIHQVLQQYDQDVSQDVTGVLAEQLGIDEVTQDKKDVQNTVNDSPITKALNAILEFAIKNKASDIHIEPLEKVLKIRCRVDGVLREIMQLPKSIEAPLVSRVKISSNLKIDEHRIPQDGNFSVNIGGKSVDLRIAISPVVWGEQVVIRLLDKSGTTLKLEEMGYHGRALREIRKGLERPNGMILTSGPTGSGKSTSLYALLQEIKSEEINIVTLEDPVEYKMSGINQIQVNAEVGLTFANGLRSILRQDPDVVMVGEIRDKETAQLAVQAALTGHLVFSTLHTNSASGILPRLLDMGIEPFLIASTVHTVIGQRLVRKIVPGGEQYQTNETETTVIQNTLKGLLPPTKEDLAKFCDDLGYKSLPLSTDSAYTLFKGKPEPNSPNGFKGRMGLYEVFEISEAIQHLILERATSTDIQKQAQAEGMITMRQDGYLKALAGMTSISEVNRVAAEDA